MDITIVNSGRAMFEQFYQKYGAKKACAAGDVFPGCVSFSLASLEISFSTVVGGEFGGGMYRLYSSSEMAYWTAMVVGAFPDYETRILCFASDWLGRHFALDRARLKNDQPLVLMFEPGTNQVLEIPADFFQFHNFELVEYQDACLASVFFNNWIDAGNEAPQKNQCIGYVKPLYLGGVDEIQNLECIDLDVYWTISAQLMAKVRGLSVGTKLGRIDID